MVAPTRNGAWSPDMTISETNRAPRAVGRDQQQARRFRNRLRHDSAQVAIVAVALALVALLAYAVKEGLAQKGIKFSFAFLANAAGFEISEGKTLSFIDGFLPSFETFTSDRSNGAAFVTGMLNTVKVAVLAIIFSTILGTLLGVGRLSTNWVVRTLSFWIVEFVRNTPLLIQLVFWYFAVVLQFPPLASAAKLYGGLIVSQQGLYLPALSWEGDGSAVSIGLATATWVAVAGAILDPVKGMRRACTVAIVILIGLFFATGRISIDYPVATRFQASGGTGLSPEMAALLLAIVVNSASYIAEIVRGAIDALPKGQWEAAGSLGLSRRNTVNDIILPQVFRVVLPSFGNQYISLAKNTALGIAIGYPDLFNVYGTVANQTGHSLEGIVIVMISYLMLSWIISAIVSWADRRLNQKGASR
ncbi:His/Glu/Gln/Arg/opine family amino acid ABC transporter permease subunit [Mycoplana sp. BE70]|uniref:ABC transporter permease subunit n=1 Tax=Mycoplana sp. BE70 TaxID=2817775 RepID=UPI00285BCCDC|nr:ABC transporter permease subunit [Mycoplana sp. BE70]MDR6759479.1 His/Glu/Gln/Arg/opine family amino acid ABC transporter permease subunit [Mycoplana sp. BE70]